MRMYLPWEKSEGKRPIENAEEIQNPRDRKGFDLFKDQNVGGKRLVSMGERSTE